MFCTIRAAGNRNICYCYEPVLAHNDHGIGILRTGIIIFYKIYLYIYYNRHRYIMRFAAGECILEYNSDDILCTHNNIIRRNILLSSFRRNVSNLLKMSINNIILLYNGNGIIRRVGRRVDRNNNSYLRPEVDTFVIGIFIVL